MRAKTNRSFNYCMFVLLLFSLTNINACSDGDNNTPSLYDKYLLIKRIATAAATEDTVASMKGDILFLLRDSNWAVRMRTTEALAKAERLDADIWNVLVLLIEDKSETVRLHAAELVATHCIDKTQAAAALAKLMLGSVNDRYAAEKYLPLLQWEGWFYSVPLLRNDDSGIRDRVYMTLPLYDKEWTAPVIRLLLLDPNPEFRSESLYWGSKVFAKERWFKNIVHQLVSDSDPDVSRIAKEIDANDSPDNQDPK